MRSQLLTASFVASALAAPTNFTALDEDTADALIARAGLDFAASCQASYPGDWKKYQMNTFIPNEIPKLVAEMYNPKAKYPSTFERAILGKATGRGIKGCQFGGCDNVDLTSICKNAPQWNWVMRATENYVSYLQQIRTSFHDAVGPVGSLLATVQTDFNPSTKSSIPDDSPLSKISSALGLAGTLAGFLPGWGEAAGAALDVASQSLEFFDKRPDPDLDAKFDGYAKLANLNGQIENALGDAITAHIDNAMGKNVPNDPNFSGDQAQVPAAITSGFFAFPLIYNTQNAKNLMIAALSAPAINAAWHREGVVVVKAAARNLPIDPCVGDNLFSRANKWCDGQGNMFVLQKVPTAAPILGGFDTAADHHVPGWESLGQFGLSYVQVIQSAWQSVLRGTGSGKGGGSPGDLAKRLLTSKASAPQVQDVAIFDLLVCDYDFNPWSSDSAATYKGYCGDYTAEHASCYFYAYMFFLCPQQNYGNDKNGNKIAWPAPN